MRNSDIRVWEETFEHFDDLQHIYFIAIDLSHEALVEWRGMRFSWSRFFFLWVGNRGYSEKKSRSGTAT